MNSIPNLQSDTGCLPCGRFLSTLEEIKQRFVTEPADQSGHRMRIWRDFERATDAIRSVTPVAAAWIGGSFVSSASAPSDIDVVYLVRADEYDAMTDENVKKRLHIFNGDKKLFKKEMLVDSYVLDWRPRGSVRPNSGTEQEVLANRGYWDDWLQRKLIPGKPLDHVANAVPQRGYLEVILDGYIT